MIARGRAVNAPHHPVSIGVEEADWLPFSLRLLEKHRTGLCPYCFYGGPGASTRTSDNPARGVANDHQR
jgi:hypothetical protein